MSQQHEAPKRYTNIQLTVLDIQNHQIRSLRRAEVVYSIPRKTIQRRRNGIHYRRDCEPNAKRLTKLEEEMIIQRVLEESTRGIPSSKADVRDMADKLLRERGSKAVSKN
jgi:hypothetical protein